MSSSALRFLSARLRQHRPTHGTRWRRLSAGRQALLPLAHLRNGQPYAQPTAGFDVGTTTVYRFGGWELTEPGGKQFLTDFFTELLARHKKPVV